MLTVHAQRADIIHRLDEMPNDFNQDAIHKTASLMLVGEQLDTEVRSGVVLTTRRPESSYSLLI